MSPKSVAGVILAAGKSERMGSPKSLLRIGNTTFLEHIDLQARSGGLSPVRIVLGHDAEKITQALPQLADRIVLNPYYELGQLSSLVRGLEAIESSLIDGLMVLLVDHPFVTTGLIRTLVRAFSSGTHLVIIPTFQGRRGHPVIFDRALFAELKGIPPCQGAAEVVRGHGDGVLHVEVENEGVLIDIDTPEVYRLHERKLAEFTTNGVAHA